LLPRLVDGQEQHGGNTTCVEVLHQGQEPIVLDAGTGVANLGDQILAHHSAEVPIHVFLTHYHWDHIMGLPFFGPIYRPGFQVNLYGRDGRPGESQAMLDTLFSPFYSPIYSPNNLLASLNLLAPVAPVEIGELRISTLTIPGSHPGGAWVIKIEHDERSLVFAPDIELRVPAVRSAFVRFCVDCDLLLCDATYDEETYARAVGWGHSSLEVSHQVGHEAGAGRVLGIHFGPTRSDKALTRAVAAGNDRFPETVLATAREGQLYEV
jgi:ribonuclease BN (tRNA processing enzyme)